MKSLSVASVGIALLFVSSLLSGADVSEHTMPSQTVPSCSALSVLPRTEMSEPQILAATRCDARAAELAWEQAYGDMTDHDRLAAVVYEP